MLTAALMEAHRRLAVLDAKNDPTTAAEVQMVKDDIAKIKLKLKGAETAHRTARVVQDVLATSPTSDDISSAPPSRSLSPTPQVCVDP